MSYTSNLSSSAPGGPRHVLVHSEALERRLLLASVPDGFTDAPVGGPFDSATAMDLAPDGRIFVTGQKGKLWIVDDGAVTNPLTLSGVKFDGERGLVGITLDPDFATNGHVFLYYTKIDDGLGRHNRVVRYTFSGNEVVGGPVSILELPDIGGATFHMGGSMHFGPDGKLYVAVGDHAQTVVAQRLDNPFGKILRINPDGTIPSDNPFYNQTSGINRAIYARGFRNPFTFNFHPQTGRLHVNDVGQDAWEEINHVHAGTNHGWPVSEGPNNTSGFTAPIFYYQNAGGRCAITGAAFYAPDSATFPGEWHDKYFFADLCFGDVRALDPSDNSVETFATGLNFPVDLDVAADGSLYYLNRSSTVSNGSIGRITFNDAQPSAPVITKQPTDVRASAGQSATFTVVATGANLSYRWQFNGQNIAGATSATLVLNDLEPADAGAYRAIVSNGQGSATSRAAALEVIAVGVAPTASIQLPTAGSLFRGGQTITFRGTANDDGPLTAANFTWQVDYHTGSVVRPFFAETSGITEGSFTIPTTTPYLATDVLYRVRLTVTDAGGLSSTVTRDVRPDVSRVTVNSSVGGARVSIDGQLKDTPASFDGVAGIRRLLSAATTQTVGGVTYLFDGWTDGGDREHTVSTPVDDVTYVARWRRQLATTSVKGLTQTIYNNRDRTGTVVTRNVNTIEFDWRTGSPDPAIHADTFFVRFRGKVQPVTSGRYTFTARADDGVRLFVNGQLIIDEWNGSHAEEVSGAIDLLAGRKYDLRLDYFEHTGSAKAVLLWETVGMPKQVIPRSRLSTAIAPQAIAPTADAYVQGGSTSGANFGDRSVLYVKNAQAERLRREAYLKFDISQLDLTSTGSAKLRLYGRLSGPGETNVRLGLFEAPKAKWDERTITHAVRPVIGPRAIATATVSNELNQWWEFDVTSFLRQQKLAGRSIVTLALRNLDTAGVYTILHAREATSNPPQIVVTV